MKKDFKVIDGIKTAYIRREGDGIPVVILHGWGAVSYTHLTLPTPPYG